MAKKNKSNSNSSNIRNTAAVFAGGVITGIVVAPYVKSALKSVAPSLDQASDKLAKAVGQTYEKASDLLAEAREKVKKG